MSMPAVNWPLPSGIMVTLPHSCVRTHSFITNASFTEMHTMRSTPLAKNAGASSLYRGTWVDEQVGVNAPGSENTTTVLPLKSSSVVSVFQSPDSVRVRKLAWGTFCPSRFLRTVGPSPKRNGPSVGTDVPAAPILCSDEPNRPL